MVLSLGCTSKSGFSSFDTVHPSGFGAFLVFYWFGSSGNRRLGSPGFWNCREVELLALVGICLYSWSCWLSWPEIWLGISITCAYGVGKKF
ncbi:hypothetical protein NL676_038437 [Syzygium grande]|nr:hypothetical protein NL676_038437 [Syzygium grande]